MALGSTQPRTVFPGGKGDRCVRLTTLPPSCAVVMNSGNLNFLEPSGPLQACSGTDFFFCLITGFVSGKQRLLKEDYEFLIINLIKDCYNLISYNYIEPEQYNP